MLILLFALYVEVHVMGSFEAFYYYTICSAMSVCLMAV